MKPLAGLLARSIFGCLPIIADSGLKIRQSMSLLMKELTVAGQLRIPSFRKPPDSLLIITGCGVMNQRLYKYRQEESVLLQFPERDGPSCFKPHELIEFYRAFIRIQNM